MNYYQHHLGDYLRDTAHLSMLEDGAYHRLLAAYYVREKPLPADQRECCKLARAASVAERKAVAYVLEQFFVLEADGYRQKRADTEIAEYQVFIDKQRAAGRASVVKRSLNHRTSNGSASVEPPYQPNGNQTATSQSPSPNPHLPVEDSTPLPPLERGASRQQVKTEKDAAVAAWIALLATNGAKRDARVQAAIDAVGGWSRIAQREQGMDANIVRKAFCDAYRAMSEPERRHSA